MECFSANTAILRYYLAEISFDLKMPKLLCSARDNKCLRIVKWMFLFFNQENMGEEANIHVMDNLKVIEN